MNRRIGRAGERRQRPPQALVWLVLGAVASSRFLAIAASPGEIEEAVFAGAVTRFDLFDGSPPAPGFPVWILLGKALLPICVTPFNALATASTALAALAAFALWAWGCRTVGGWAALAGVVLAFASPVVWIHGGRAFPDTAGTALFLGALACLAIAEERRSPNQTRWREMIAARRARLYALSAGLLAAAGAGVSPRLALAFGPLLLLGALRLASRWDRHDAVASFFGAALAGTAAWTVWLLAEAGGSLGLVATLAERFPPAPASAGGAFAALLDSFLVRDFLAPGRAAAVFLVAGAGLVALALRRRRGAADLLVVLVPMFLSLWLLGARALPHRSVPFVLVLALAAGAGLEGLLRKGPAAFLAALAVGALQTREAWPEIRASAREEAPPVAAIRSLERRAHQSRAVIAADDEFRAFLRAERLEGRLGALDEASPASLAASRTTGRRWARLADFTAEPDPPSRHDPAWATWERSGRIAEALGARRLLVVSVRDPAPPLFGRGFGGRERPPGRPSFRWAGPAAHLLVPADQGPAAATLSGERPAGAGTTTLTVAEAASGRRLVERAVAPGPFDLTILDRAVYGPMPGPAEYVISCDAPVDLPVLRGASRPRKGCFTFLEAAFSRPPAQVWMRQGARVVADLGAPDDGRYDPDGFWPRERAANAGPDVRWTREAASLAWSPVPGFSPARVVLRARSAAGERDAEIFVDGILAGAVRVGAGLAEVSAPLAPDAARRLAGPDPARIGIRARAESRPGDPRALGIAIDRIGFE